MKSRKELINDLRRQGALDIKEVVQWTNRLLPHFVPTQNRYKVADRVTVRIIRYYLNQSLVSKPDGYKGRHSRYGADQVIQILVIKSLQAQYVPLKKIAQIMSSVRESDLLAWLLENNHRDQPVPPPSSVVESMVDPLNSRTFPVVASINEVSDIKWQHFSIHDDIELLLRPSFNLLDNPSESGEIFSKIIQVLTNQMSSSESRTFARENNGPAKAIKDPSNAVIALITEGGLVPMGNPDHLPSVRSENYMRYSLEGLNDLVAGQFESVDRGWDNTYVNSDPDRLLPLDVMRELEGQHLFNRLHKYFYSMTGAGTTIENARRIGRNIAREIRNIGISAVIFTAT